MDNNLDVGFLEQLKSTKDLIIDEKYFNLTVDKRFPLIIAESGWQLLKSGMFKTFIKKCSIYLLKYNNHLYVGSDGNGRRPWNHKARLFKKEHDNYYMQNCYNKCDGDNFYYLSLFEIPTEFQYYRDQIENAYIKLFRTFVGKNPLGFNLVEFADAKNLIGESNPFYGKKHTLEAREKMSNASRGKIISDEQKRILSRTHKGKPKSEEHKRKMSESGKGRLYSEDARKNISEGQIKRYVDGGVHPRTGKKHTEESKKKMSESGKALKRIPFFKGKNLSEEIRKKISDSKQQDQGAKKHIFINPNGEVVEIFNLAKFCRQNNLQSSNMIVVKTGGQKSHKGWTKFTE